MVDALECITDDDLCLLAEVTPGTAENWRKRGIGPAYIIAGNRVLYPREGVAKWLAGRVRERRSPAAKDAL